ncbi:MAG: hypothetical protein FJ167_08585 [Gammaproteobacteria bacterium]|nr:hypothetical protein [Gammaproteobacteria bacterium]MBM4209139.1 hypothetical protein [Gammaproteobacteria bacterium]MBM4224833.1 hypothetical protein [Gammaproteobacteria bacterium]MBM4230649.1 hypothetical protein [Gammaproteobacteria bacterium]
MRSRSSKSLSLVLTVWMIVAGTLFSWTVQAAESVTAGQERAAAEYLAAVAAGDAQAVAFAIHPTELDRLRIMTVQKLREEAARGESAMRIRLFGDGMPLGEIERLTSVNLFRSLARKLNVRSRVYEKLEGLTAVRDGNQLHVLVKGKQPRDRGRVEVVELVTLLPYGKEWKAAIAPELEAQIDDVLNGRTRGTTTPSSGPTAVERAVPVATARNTPEILALLEQAEKALVDGKCDRYYRDYLSPELRRSLSSRTLDSLVSGCNRSIASRELLIAALRIVRRTAPALEREGNRAVYDVEGQGLPFDRYVLERIDGRWYIAE